MVTRVYLRLYDFVSRRRWVPVAILCLALLAMLPLAGGVRLDMSFRPLFADETELAEATRQFEAVFGQASGAHIGVIIERPDVLDAAFFRDLWQLSEEVEGVEGIGDVTSLARVALVEWSGERPRGTWAIAPEAVSSASDAELEERIRRLAQGDGVRGVIVSRDGGSTLLLARVLIPLEDLPGRSRVIEEFRALVAQRLGPTSGLRFVGVSVVEQSYAEIVLASLARSFVLTTLAILLVLGLLFRRPGAVAVVMAGVTLAVPASMGILTLLGQDLTMINSIVPIMIMIIGVADGIHMLESFSSQVRAGEAKPDAIRGMFGDMAVPCLLTTVTTALGFLALHAARISAIRDFGVNVAIGVTTVYVLNLLLIPLLLTLLPPSALIDRRAARGVSGGWSGSLAEHVLARPRTIILGCVAAVAAAVLLVPRLHVDQRFNEEVRPSHPVRADQTVLEREFSGILGPEVTLRRRDGSSMLDATSLRRLSELHRAAEALPGVLGVSSVVDLLPEEGGTSSSTLELRADPLLGPRARTLVSSSGAQLALSVRTADVGTRAALELGSELQRLAERSLGPQYEAEIVGQWWLAQRGMDNILRDMLTSFAASCLLVLPIVGLVLRRTRFVLIGILPNLFPMLFAVAFMAATGISLRIGTAMILAIALGVAIDDGIHLLLRLEKEEGRHADPRAAVRATLSSTGRAIGSTTLVLVLGFLSMLSNDLLAIREMGLVAAVTLIVALLVNFLVAPALFVLTSRAGARSLPYVSVGVLTPETPT